MLRYFLSSKLYRTLKNGLLIDYYTKRFIFYISKFFTVTFTHFFGDKFLLEGLFANLKKFFTILFDKLTGFRRYSFIALFKFAVFISFYVVIILFWLWI